MYVVPAAGAHEGPEGIPDNLEEAVLVGLAPGSKIPEVSFEAAVTQPPAEMPFTYALGYSYKDDPNFHHCAEELALKIGGDGDGGLFLGKCLLSGGASGGPWIQGDAQNHKLISINSWGYGCQSGANCIPGMGAPRLDNVMGGHASDVFALAKCSAFSSAGPTSGGGGNGVIWCDDGTDGTQLEGICTAGVGAPYIGAPAPIGGTCQLGPSQAPTRAPTRAPTPPTVPPTAPPTGEGCVDKTLADKVTPWYDNDGATYDCT